MLGFGSYDFDLDLVVSISSLGNLKASMGIVVNMINASVRERIFRLVLVY